MVDEKNKKNTKRKISNRACALTQGSGSAQNSSEDTENSKEERKHSKEGPKKQHSKESKRANNNSKQAVQRNNTEKEVTNKAKKPKSRKPMSNTNRETTSTQLVINHIQKIGWAGVDREFTTVRSMLQRDVHTYTSFSKNPVKNRFMDVVCLDKTRHVLYTNVPPMTDYIHANRVRMMDGDRDFVATQAPMESTLEDFWRLIYDVNPPYVICLQEVEVISGRKGESYFPLKVGEKMVYGCMTVTNKQVYLGDEAAKQAGYQHVQLEIVLDECDLSAITIKLIQTSDWPDCGTVAHERRAAISIVKEMEVNQSGTVVVLCAAGIGRTATYILLNTVLTKLRHSKTINLPNMLLELRQQRASSIQTLEQYANIYVLLIEYLISTSEGQYGTVGHQLLTDYCQYRKTREGR